MSKAKDRKRVEEGRVFRSGADTIVPRYVCPFPDCGKTFWKAEGQPDVCPDHRKLLKDIAFALSHFIKVRIPNEEAIGKDTLLIPKPGMGKLAIDEALRRRAKIGD